MLQRVAVVAVAKESRSVRGMAVNHVQPINLVLLVHPVVITKQLRVLKVHLQVEQQLVLCALQVNITMQLDKLLAKVVKQGRFILST